MEQILSSHCTEQKIEALAPGPIVITELGLELWTAGPQSLDPCSLYFPGSANTEDTDQVTGVSYKNLHG